MILRNLALADALPQRRWRYPEEALEPRRKVAVAGKARVKRNGRDVAAVEHGLERLGQPLAQHIVVDRAAGSLAEHTTEMEMGQVRDFRQRPDAPVSPGRHRHRLLHALDGARVTEMRRALQRWHFTQGTETQVQKL